MFKIIKLNNIGITEIIKLDDFNCFNYPNDFSSELLKNNAMVQSENFERTLAGKGLTDVLDLEKRSSWTHK